MGVRGFLQVTLSFVFFPHGIWWWEFIFPNTHTSTLILNLNFSQISRYDNNNIISKHKKKNWIHKKKNWTDWSDQEEECWTVSSDLLRHHDTWTHARGALRSKIWSDASFSGPSWVVLGSELRQYLSNYECFWMTALTINHKASLLTHISPRTSHSLIWTTQMALPPAAPPDRQRDVFKHTHLYQ